MKKIARSVWTATGGAVLLFALYEAVKTLLFPRISLISSHVMTVIVAGALSFLVSRYALKRHQAALEQIQQQTSVMEEANRLLSGVLGTMREGVLIVNSQMSVVLHNDAAARILKWPSTGNAAPRELAQEGKATRLADATRDPVIHEAFARALEQRSAGDYRVELAGPEPRIFQLNVAPLGHQLVVGVFFDITEVERLERVRREFFANLSHELRTPLTAIIAHAETLLSGAADDPQDRIHFLERLQRQAARMRELVSDISDLAAIEAGHVSLETRPVRLCDVATDVTGLLDGRAAESNLSLAVAIPDDLVVAADRSLLEQILFNLIDNAVKFNRPGGSITVAARKEGGQVLVSVEDTGIGIASPDLPRVFERLYRADKSRSRKTEGTGLGLAIVKHLVQAQGGQVAATSELGRGSCFTFSLPPSLAEAASPDAANSCHASSQPKRT